MVRLPGGQRRSIAYDVVARVVDAALPRLAPGAGERADGSVDRSAEGSGQPASPLVDVVVVSSWARTGWDVHAPNLLIDATGTHDRIAWRQLRGRALRPWPGPFPAGGKISHLYALVPARGHRAAVDPLPDPRAADVPLLAPGSPPAPSAGDLDARLATDLPGADDRIARHWLAP